MPNNVLSANTMKKTKNMPNYDVHAKQNFLMSNHFK